MTQKTIFNPQEERTLLSQNANAMDASPLGSLGVELAEEARLIQHERDVAYCWWGDDGGNNLD